MWFFWPVHIVWQRTTRYSFLHYSAIFLCIFSIFHSGKWYFFHVALFSCYGCILFMLHFAHVEVFPCCNFFVLQSFHLALFYVAIFSFSTFFILHYFHVALFKLRFLRFAFFSCCTLSMLHFSPDEFCSCCTISMLYLFRVASSIFFRFRL